MTISLGTSISNQNLIVLIPINFIIFFDIAIFKKLVRSLIEFSFVATFICKTDIVPTIFVGC